MAAIGLPAVVASATMPGGPQDDSTQVVFSWGTNFYTTSALLPAESFDEPHLSKEACNAVQIIRRLGMGAGRTAWEARVPRVSQCHEFGHHQCQENATVVWKAVNGNFTFKAAETAEETSRRREDIIQKVKASNLQEAKLLHSFQKQYGPQASVRLYGLCCDEHGGTGAAGASSIIMEKLEPLTRDVSEEQLRLWAGRMANFSVGPLIIHDFKWSSLGQNPLGHVHALDLGYVHMAMPTAENRRRVFEYTFDCMMKNIGQLKSKAAEWSPNPICTPGRHGLAVPPTHYRVYFGRNATQEKLHPSFTCRPDVMMEGRGGGGSGSASGSGGSSPPPTPPPPVRPPRAPRGAGGARRARRAGATLSEQVKVLQRELGLTRSSDKSMKESVQEAARQLGLDEKEVASRPLVEVVAMCMQRLDGLSTGSS